MRPDPPFSALSAVLVRFALVHQPCDSLHLRERPVPFPVSFGGRPHIAVSVSRLLSGLAGGIRPPSTMIGRKLNTASVPTPPPTHLPRARCLRLDTETQQGSRRPKFLRSVTYFLKIFFGPRPASISAFITDKWRSAMDNGRPLRFYMSRGNRQG